MNNIEGTEMYKLGIDIGFGDVKCIVGNDSEILSKWKFPSVVAPVEVNEHITDPRAIHYDGNNYYVGNDALKLESEYQMSVDEYRHLEAFTPIILQYVISKLDKSVPITSLVVGLSVAHIQYAKNYYLAVEKYLESIGSSNTKILVLPQGSGVKLAYDKYGNSFPVDTTNMTSNDNYLICDVGFNTVDLLYVMDGRVSPNRIGGVEGMGLVVVAKLLDGKIKESYSNLEFSIKDLKTILDKGYMQVRGVKVDLREDIKVLKTSYLKLIEGLLEDKYGKVLDKVDYLLLSGGGATYFSDIESAFYRTTGPESCYYNAIGYWLKSRS